MALKKSVYIQILFCFLLMTLLTSAVYSQVLSRVHIVTTKDNRMYGFRLHCTINGEQYKLNPGTCLELQISADSLHVLMKDTRLVKNVPVDLHIKSEAEMYVHIFWGYRTTEKPHKVRAFAESVCKACFEELKKKCRKTVSGSEN